VDFERAPSLCLHCSLGCNTVGSAQYREVVRLEARPNDAVNGYFICDRGRYGFAYANHPERPAGPAYTAGKSPGTRLLSPQRLSWPGSAGSMGPGP